MDIKIQLCEICHTPLVLPDCTKRHWRTENMIQPISRATLTGSFQRYLAQTKGIKAKTVTVLGHSASVHRSGGPCLHVMWRGKRMRIRCMHVVERIAMI
jgi:hypothetical protein